MPSHPDLSEGIKTPQDGGGSGVLLVPASSPTLPASLEERPQHSCPASPNHKPLAYRKRPLEFSSPPHALSAFRLPCRQPQGCKGNPVHKSHPASHFSESCSGPALPSSHLLVPIHLSAAQSPHNFLFSPPAATIASTDMGLLLRDEVFVDFFNTFLNLPVSLLLPLKAGTFLSLSQVNFWVRC